MNYEEIKPGMTPEAQMEAAREIAAALRPAPAAPTPHPGERPAAGKAAQEYEAKLDAHVQGLLQKPASSLTDAEQRTLFGEIGRFLRGKE